MPHAERNERRFVLAQQKLLFAARDERRAAHDDPVLRAMVMHLQRQLRTRRHHDALHLEAFAVLDRIVETPRTAHLAMRVRLGRMLLADARNEPLDVLHARTVRDQHGVVRLDDDHVGRAHARDEPSAFGARIARGRAFEHHAPARDVAGLVLVHRVPHGVPRTEIRPARNERHDHAVARLARRADVLHHGIVD
ncbi:hypothetical protein AWB74_08875 [Caballeronia arvi]|uniref:Uncharacterized protein n=1 Tax=Caballeronia arvi TaxID=1777135 RepID=A0A158L6V1_9BURK|nr:hypothetical protein AWB74_08875 [Caballeronia arvi]